MMPAAISRPGYRFFIVFMLREVRERARCARSRMRGAKRKMRALRQEAQRSAQRCHYLLFHYYFDYYSSFSYAIVSRTFILAMPRCHFTIIFIFDAHISVMIIIAC